MRPFYVYNRWGKQIDTIPWPTEAIHKDTLNGEDSLSLTVLGTPLDKGQRVVWRDKFLNWHEHTVTDTQTIHRDGELYEIAYCENSIAELLTDILEEVEPRAATSQSALERALEKSRWVPGTVQPTGTHDFSWYHQTAYSAVTDIVETFGAELYTTVVPREDVIFERKVDILNHRGDDYGHIFAYGYNLAGVERDVTTEAIYTALYGYGKGTEQYDEETGEATGGYSRKISFADINGGIPWVGDDDAKMRYGVPDGKGDVKHAFGIIEFSDCEDPEELLELTKDALKTASKPQVTYSGDILNLAAGGYANGEDSQPGDTVYIRDQVLDERLQGRVLEVERDLLDESNTKVTLGNIKSTFTQKMAKDLADLDWLKDQSSKWNDVVVLPDAYLDAVINRLNILFNTTGGFVYYEKGEGLITYDRPKDQNPTMAIQIVGAGFRIANSKNSDGSWNWRTFGTGDGFTADELITGVIKGGSNFWNLGTGDLRFEQGSISSTDGVNFWNLTSGELQLGHGWIHDLAGNNSWNLDTGELKISSGTKVGNLALSDYVETESQTAAEQLLADRMTQQEIFNTLTNGGSEQGIYLQNGRVYINSTYIGAGILQAGRIQDRSNNNYWDLETGEFKLSSSAKVGNLSLDAYVDSKTKTAAEQLIDDRLTQEAVFNALTDGGQTQGIYLQGHRVYINATYIGTGTLQAGKIQDKAGNNYWDLETGEFRLSMKASVGGKALDSFVDDLARESASSATASMKSQIDKDINDLKNTFGNYVSTSDFNNYLTQRAVFNALTRNGLDKGIYLTGNVLYINGDYIRTGIIESTNSTSAWDLNSGFLQTVTSGTAGGQSHKYIGRMTYGRYELIMDVTRVGYLGAETASNNPNNHYIALKSFSSLILGGPQHVSVTYSSATENSTSYYDTLSDFTMKFVADVWTESGSGGKYLKVNFSKWQARYRHGMMTSNVDNGSTWFDITLP